MLEIYTEIVRILSSGGRAALVTVVDTDGASPGHVGAKMVVREDGTTVGTVGGGVLEARATAAGVHAISRRRSERMIHGVDEGGLASLGMTCGGGVELLVEYLAEGPEVYIFGAGHVGLAVGELAKYAGFRVTIIDDRAEFANAENAPWADRVVAEEYAAAAAGVPGGRDCYVVIMTRGHEWDAEVLFQVLAMDPLPFYVGMIGSSNKIAGCYERVRAQGASEEAIAHVHAPIGIPIGGVAPREIAVSVVAEMIAARYGRDDKCHS